MASQLSTRFGKKVAYLDTSDEIADDAAARICIGKARHVRVLDSSNQAYEVSKGSPQHSRFVNQINNDSTHSHEMVVMRNFCALSYWGNQIDNVARQDHADIIVIDELNSLDELRVIDQLMQQGLTFLAGVNCTHLEHFVSSHTLRCALGLTSKMHKLVYPQPL
jgi:stage III sporulation protein SpoIIIAA